MIYRLFLFIYDSEPSRLIKHDESGDSADEDGKDKITQNREFRQLAKELAAKIPEFEFSPAEIMSFLLANKHLPRRAVADVDAWMKKNREDRKKLSRTGSWALNDEDEIKDH
jgi:chaperone BCS1